MATEKQIAANRENAQKSTGPKTEEGKERVRWNALTHGYTTEQFPLESEEEPAFRRMADELRESLQPEGGAETHAFYEYLRATWNLRLIGCDEAQCLNLAHDEQYLAEVVEMWADSRWARRLALLGRYRAEHQRAQKHALATLLALKKERRESAREQSRVALEERKLRQEDLKELLLRAKLDAKPPRDKEMPKKGAGAKQSQIRGEGPGTSGQKTGNRGERKGPDSAPKAA